MQIRKGTPPPSVERELAVDLTRDEVLAVLVNYIKTKLGSNVRLSDISVAADELDKLTSVTISGVEVIPLVWKANDDVAKPTQAPTPQPK